MPRPMSIDWVVNPNVRCLNVFVGIFSFEVKKRLRGIGSFEAFGSSGEAHSRY